MHIGHLFVIEKALKTAIDKLYVVVSPQSPFKSMYDLASFNDRLEIAKATIKDRGLEDRVEVVDWERNNYPSYTIDTLEHAKKLLGENNEYTIFMGLDNFKSIDTWKCSNQIVSEYGIYIIPRDSENPTSIINEKITMLKEFYGNVKSITYSNPFESISISATDIRNILEKGEVLPKGVLSPSAIKYIQDKQLYNKQAVVVESKKIP